MRVICVDLEMNQPSQKIIQIGAVCFDPYNGAIFDTFNELVNPGEQISQEITELTGITNEDVSNKSSILVAATLLNSFKNRLNINPIGIVWGAGRSNDVRKIYEESGIESNFKDRIIDVKGIFNMLANSSTSEYRSKVGLGRALEILGLGWDLKYGKQHNALADAYNTYRLYMFLSKCLKGAVDIKLG